MNNTQDYTVQNDTYRGLIQVTHGKVSTLRIADAHVLQTFEIESVEKLRALRELLDQMMSEVQKLEGEI